MNKIILAAIGFSLVAVSSAQAQHRGSHPQQPHGVYRVAPPHVVKHHAVKRPQVKRHRWQRGQRYADWRRHQHVSDYHRYGLHRPARGQQWIKVNNDYLLISAATGLIAGIIAGR